MDRKCSTAESHPACACELMKLKEVAATCAISIRHLRRLIDAGKMPAPIFLGRSLRIRRSDLSAWVEAGCPAVAADGKEERHG